MAAFGQPLGEHSFFTISNYVLVQTQRNVEENILYSSQRMDCMCACVSGGGVLKA